ncbi:IS30 family transposase [Nocardiopsis potens]|uniref:IS30 family transposase n=1 Tax=Nocardiopsis potens TaxID=1246458 RepID=UPI00034DDB2C|nr:IS30 family transposase [Nocardiopsis potens]
MPGKRLTITEREEILVGVTNGESNAAIAARLGRDRTTVWRERRRNTSPSPRAYRAFPAHIRATARARRPRARKLAPGTRLRARVAADLAQGWSPQQVAGRLAAMDPRERVSHETIYRALYVQAKGCLREQVEALAAGAPRCPGRAARRPRARTPARPRFEAMVNISERPAEAADRAVPGHWEGDLVIGREGGSAIATLVERSTRFALLVPVGDRRAQTVGAALSAHIGALPAALKRTLTWDQGVEMARHREFSVATGVPVFFCDPHSPWQRGTNENTNRLVRDYFPKGATDFNSVDPAELARVQDLLNTRPRKTLGYRTPAEALNDFLVATTD